MVSWQVKIVITAIVLVLAIIVGWRLLTCGPCRSNIKMERVNLITTDNIKIVGNYYPANGERGVIMAHQFGRDKSSWGDLPELLQKEGFTVLTIDLRGHGESDLKYQNFSDLDFNKMVLDIEAGETYLRQQNKMTISLMGSSIGANLSLIEKGRGGFNKAVALSPGLNFKGLDAEKGAKAIAAQKINKKEVLLIASVDDAYSYDSVEMIGKILDGVSEISVFQEGGHGVALLSGRPELKTKIINFLNS